jgi:hypothetical protein
MFAKQRLSSVTCNIRISKTYVRLKNRCTAQCRIEAYTVYRLAKLSALILGLAVSIDIEKLSLQRARIENILAPIGIITNVTVTAVLWVV